MKLRSVPTQNTTVITVTSDLGFLCVSLIGSWRQK